MNEYIIGSKEPAPPWCRDLLMTYRRMDGSSGFEFYGVHETFYLKPGDMLVYQQGRIEIIRKGRGEK